MKRYDLHQCEGYGSDCNAEMMESSIGDWVDAVEAINTIAILREALEKIALEPPADGYSCQQWALEALHRAGGGE